MDFLNDQQQEWMNRKSLNFKRCDQFIYKTI